MFNYEPSEREKRIERKLENDADYRQAYYDGVINFIVGWGLCLVVVPGFTFLTAYFILLSIGGLTGWYP